jgi:thiamine-monophosphate kinase
LSLPKLTPLGDGSEFDKIRAIWRVLGERGAGGGDDCAIVEIGSERLAISTDMAVEGTHFRTDWLSFKEIGWRAGAAALSDLAAVAATPVGVLVSLGVPPDLPDNSAVSLMDGLGAVAESVGATVWGGDLVRSDGIIVDVVAIGRVSSPVLRSGAEVGNTLWVTGRLGGPATALEIWGRGEEPDQCSRARFAGPVPRVAEALWLRDRGAKALIDLSDGLVADAGQLAAASGVACVIEAARVPLSHGADQRAALLGGEEFELLIALPAKNVAELSSEFEDAFGISLTGVGHVEDGSGVRVMNAGVPMRLSGGFRHFKS